MPQRFWGPGPPGFWDPENRKPGSRGPKPRSSGAQGSRPDVRPDRAVGVIQARRLILEGWANHADKKINTPGSYVFGPEIGEASKSGIL